MSHPTTTKELWFSVKKKARENVPKAFLNIYFSLYPFIGNIFFGKPSQKIKLIAVTGTDGKSSTVIFIASILREAGYKVGHFSSVSYSDGVHTNQNTIKMTMPGRLFLQRFLKTLVSNGCDFGVLEVTSEGIKQKRHLFIDFDIALVTNLNPEHIESHGSFEIYKDTKATIFKNIKSGYSKKIPKTIIVNNDDVETRSFRDHPSDQTYSFGMSADSDISAKIMHSDIFHNIVQIRTKGGEEASLTLSSGSPFVVENALAAIAATYSLKIPLSISTNALQKIIHPVGRFEIISQNPIIIIDYAHTVAAVKKLLTHLRSNFNGTIIHVFGAAGGGRDKWKRPRLAELSEKYTDISILTEENSFDEPTETILDDIHTGFMNKERVSVIINRKEAIAQALRIAKEKENSMLIFTGKGSETVIAGPFARKTPYNEKETTLCLLGNL